MISRSRTVLVAGLLTLAPLAMAAPAQASLSVSPKTPKAGTCFGKKPTIVVTKARTSLTLTKKNKNTVIDLLGKGDSVNASRSAGFTYVCDSGGARSIITGAGNDKVTIKDGSPTVSTGAGNDTFTQTGTGNPVVHLGAGVDSGTLAKGNGTIYGDDGNDTLRVGSKGRQKAFGGHGHDTLVAGAATSTLDGQDGGTAYLVPTLFVKNTTVVLHPGDTLNGKNPAGPVTTPPVSPVSPPAPAPVPVPVAVPPMPVGAVVDMIYGKTVSASFVGAQNSFGLSGAAGSGRTLSGWSLDFGDGNAVHRGIGTPPNAVAHVYYAAGSYVATLTLTDDLGRSTQTQETIDVAGPDAVTVSVTSGSGSPAYQTSTTVNVAIVNKPGARAGFIMSSVDFGDGSGPTTTGGPAAGTLSHDYSYAGPGSYTISVFETDDHGDGAYAATLVRIVDASNSGTVHVSLVDGNGNPEKQVLGSASGTSIDASRSVGIGTGAFTALTFDPGNGSSVKDLLADPSTYITYSSGSYTAKLSGTSGGKTATASYPVYVAGGTSSTATGPADPATTPAGTPITFNSVVTLGSTPSGGPANKIVSDTFDFGDDTDRAGVSGSTITHTFTKPGIYSVFNEAKDLYGGPNGYTGLNVVVTQSTPVLDLSIGSGSAGSPWSGTTVSPDPKKPGTFANLSGFGSSGHLANATFRLDWGDGSTPDVGSSGNQAYVTDPFLQHAYASAGEFTATASLTDSANLTTTVVTHVSVSSPPTLTLGTPTITNGVLTQPVTASSAGSNGAAPDTYSISVDPKTGSSFETMGNGAPGSISLPVPAGTTGPYTVYVGFSTTHGFVSATSTVS